MAWNVLKTDHIVANADMAGVVTTPPLGVKLQDNVGYQCYWDGAPVGTFYVDVSFDYDVDTRNLGTWTSLPLNPVVAASGAPDDALFELNQLSAPFVRLRYVPTSGAGTLNIYCSAKGV